MNISYIPSFIANLPLGVKQAGLNCIRTAASLLIPGGILYFAIYFHWRRCENLHTLLTFFSLAAFCLTPVLAPISCGPIQCVQNFAGKFHTIIYLSSNHTNSVIVAIGIMKTIDIWVRRKSFPRYTGKPPPDWFVFNDANILLSCPYPLFLKF